MQTNVQFYTFSYSETKTYLTAALFILGNVMLPYLFHLFPHGGMMWLPIYFFTLIGAYKYGWKVGLLTALCSPLLNSFLFGMPLLANLPAILTKSILLAIGAGVTAQRYRNVSIPLLSAVVLFYQVFGTLLEWLFLRDLTSALQDFRIGVPGMLLQIIGGYTVINYLLRK